MVHPALKIEVYRSDARHSGGTPLSGVVSMTSDAPAEIRLELLCRAFRKGEHLAGILEEFMTDLMRWHVVAEVMLRRDPVRGVWPFQIDVPNGPATYYGEGVTLLWELQATAWWPGRSSTKARTEIVVVPSNIGPYHAGKTTAAPARETEAEDDGVAANVVYVLLGVFLLAAFQLPVMAGILAALLPIIVVRAVRRRRLRAKLGRIRWSVAPEVLHAGATALVRVVMVPEADLTVREVVVQWRSFEEWLEGGEDGACSAEYVVRRGRLRSVGPLALDEGEVYDVADHLRIPVEVPPTFELSNYAVRFEVTLSIELDGGQRITEKKWLTVGPPVAALAAADGPMARSGGSAVS